MRAAELRLHNVRLLCLACRTPLAIPGPWNGALMARFRDQHRWVLLAGWTVTAGCRHVSDLERYVPPAVHVRWPA